MRKSLVLVMVLVCGAVLGGAKLKGARGGERVKRAPGVLERNVRLDVKTVPADDGDEGMFVVVACPQYATRVKLEGEEGEIFFEMAGEVRLLGDDLIFVSYDTETTIKGEEGVAHFSVSSGVILRAGQELGVARMGDKTLMIRASYVD